MPSTGAGLGRLEEAPGTRPLLETCWSACLWPLDRVRLLGSYPLFFARPSGQRQYGSRPTLASITVNPSWDPKTAGKVVKLENVSGLGTTKGYASELLTWLSA